MALGIGALYLNDKAISSRMQELEAEAAKGREMVTVVVPVRDLAKGERLTPDVVAARQVPAQYAHALALKPQNFGDYANEPLIAPINRGEVLLPSHVDGMGDRTFSSLLSKGMRALTFEVDEISSISGMLKPGDRIDLIFRAREIDTGGQPASDVIFPLLSNVKVLATGQKITKKAEDGRDQTFSSVTMEVTPLDADRILLARAAGNLTAVLRHPDDLEPNGAGRLNLANLMSSSPQKGPGLGRTVEYIAGGGGAPGTIALISARSAAKPLGKPQQVGVEASAAAAARALQEAAARSTSGGAPMPETSPKPVSTKP